MKLQVRGNAQGDEVELTIAFATTVYQQKDNVVF